MQLYSYIQRYYRVLRAASGALRLGLRLAGRESAYTCAHARSRRPCLKGWRCSSRATCLARACTLQTCHRNQPTTVSPRKGMQKVSCYLARWRWATCTSYCTRMKGCPRCVCSEREASVPAFLAVVLRTAHCVCRLRILREKL